jgi:hypothetical protein
MQLSGASDLPASTARSFGKAAKAAQPFGPPATGGLVVSNADKGKRAMPKQWKPGELRNGGQYLPLTVGELRAAISELDEDVQLDFGSALGGRALLFYRFVWRGKKMLQIELSENDPDARD